MTKTKKMKRTIAGFLLAAFFLSGNLIAQQKDTATYTFTLKQAVDYAVTNNTTVKNAVLDQQQATYKMKEIVGIGLPQISGSLDVKDYLEIPTSLIPGEFFGGPAGSFIPVKFGTKYNASVGASASQLVFSGSWLVGVKGAQVYQELAKKNVDRTMLETSSDVTKAYYTAMINQERKELLDANIVLVKKIKDDTKAFLDQGFAEQIDLDRITVTYNNLLIEAENVKRLLDLSLVMLKYQIGMDQAATLIIADKIKDLNFEAQQNANDKFDYTKRIEYQMLDLSLRGRKLFVRAERFGYIPSIALYGTLQTQAQRTKFDFFDTNQKWFPIALIGLQVNIPIFDGLQRHYRVQQTRVDVFKAENDLLFMQRTIDMQQAITKVNLENSASTLQARKSNMELAQRILDNVLKKNGQGTVANLEILNAQTALKEAQTNYFNALYDAVVAKVEYEKAIGIFKR
jgi:outer membrane protein